MRRASAALILAALLCGAGPSTAAAPPAKVRVWKIDYRAHNGARRNAYVLLPSWYGPHNHPAIPLVISPHGRGLTGRRNAALWGNLPAVGGFAVVNPDGQGRRLPDYSWGSPGQVEDLFDAVTNFALQYREFPRLRCTRVCHKAWAGSLGRGLQTLAREEIGGPPHELPRAWAMRSPVTYERAIARSCVPLQIWWSNADRIVIDQRHGQSGPFFWKLRELNPEAPVQAFVGYWIHSAEMKAHGLLPLALARFDLLPPEYEELTHGLHLIPLPNSWPACGMTR